MPGRSFSSGSYRYGFNGKENDNEVKGTGNEQDYGFRIYDTRLGRFLSVDPLTAKNAHQSPYSAMNINPIIYVDPDGRDGIISIQGNTITVSCKIYLYGSGATAANAKQMQSDIMGRWGTNKGKGWTYTDASGKVYDVKFDVSVQLYKGKEKSDPFIIPESWNPRNRENFVEVGATLKEVGRSHVSGGDEGEWRGVGRNGMTLAQDNPAPHEFGHLLGLDDRYTDKNGPNPGWSGNIMADGQNGKVEQRNIDAIVGDAVKGYNKFSSKKENANKTYTHEIDIDRPNKEQK